MRRRHVVVAILLRFSRFFKLSSVLILMSCQSLLAADIERLPRPENFSVPASISRYAEIAPKSEEAVVDLLNRVSEYAKTGDRFDDPIVIMLHGAEARVFAQGNYNMYRSVVDLARELDDQGVIDVQICEVWMSVNGVSFEEIPDFIDPVPYGAAVIDEMVDSGSVVF